VTEIVISGRALDSRNQPVADLPREISISVTEILISAAEMIINKPATIISKRETVMSAPDVIMSGPHIIIYKHDIYRHDAMMSALETVICAAETSIYRADIAIPAFGTSFSAAEIRISAAVKTAGAAPAGLLPIASQPSTIRLAFVLMAKVRPGSTGRTRISANASLLNSANSIQRLIQEILALSTTLN